MQVKEQQLEPDMEQQTDSGLGKEYVNMSKICILLPSLLNFYAEYTMQNAGLNEAQGGIKISGRNINNLRYANDTTFIAESEQKLKSLLMKVEVESGKSWLKTQHSKN